MIISEYLTHLSKQFSVSVLSQGPEITVTSFKVVDDDVDFDVQQQILIDTSQRKLSLKKDMVVITARSIETNTPCWLIKAKPEDIHSIINFTADLFFENQSKQQKFEQLLFKRFPKNSFHDLVNEVANFLECSILLCDLSFYVIDYSTSIKITDPLWNNNIKRGYCTYKFISAVNQLLPDHILDHLPNPFFVDCHQSKERRLCSYLYYNQRVVGYVIMLDNQKGISPYHLTYLPKIAELLSLSITQIPDFSNLFSSIGDNIILALLNQSTTYEDQLIINQNALGLDKDLSCVVFQMNQQTSHDLFFLQHRLKSFLNKCPLVIFQNHLVAVLNSDQLKLLTNPKQQFDYFKIIHRIGISESFSDLNQLLIHYQQAKQACYLADKLHHQPLINHYEHYHFFDILLSCSDQRLVKSFIHPAIIMLAKIDQEQHSELLPTLKTYIENSCHAKQTAQALFLHRNTLNYRLNRIKELTDLQFTDIHELFSLTCSFYICELFPINQNLM